MAECRACDLTWTGPYTDCPGCQAQAGMRAVSDFAQLLANHDALARHLLARDAEIARLREERDQLREVLETLVTKLHAVHADPRYVTVWQQYALHGGRYSEPTYTAELAAADAILSGPAEAGR